MKLSKMIILLQEHYKRYQLKHNREPILFIGDDGICLCSKKVKINGLDLYEGPFMKLPKVIHKTLGVE